MSPNTKSKTVRRSTTQWMNISEFRFVKELLFSEDVCDQKRGIDQLKAWKARSQKLPVAIGCTWDLVEISLQKKNDQRDSDNFKLACTMAVTRLVNLHTEELQRFGRSRPVHELAEKIGLPKWLVDIRHQGTHGHMPERPTLEAALSFCLAWLKQSFWVKQTQQMQDGADRSPQDFQGKDKAKIDKTLSAYMDYMASLLQNNAASGRQTVTVDEVLRPLKKPMRGVASRNYVAQLLSTDGYLAPTKEQEQALRNQNDGSNTNGLLPPALLAFWKPFLDYVQPVGVEPILVTYIVQRLSKMAKQPSSPDTIADSRYLEGWARELIRRDGHALATGGIEMEASSPRKRGKRIVSWNKTVEACVKQPSKQSLELLPSLLPLADNPPLPKKSQNDLLDLVKLRVLGPNGLSEQPNGMPSLDEIERMIHVAMEREDRKRMGEALAAEGGSKEPPGGQVGNTSEAVEAWSICDDTVDWGRVPLGMLPGQRLDPTFLQLKPNQNKRKRKLSNSANDSRFEEDIVTSKRFAKSTPSHSVGH